MGLISDYLKLQQDFEVKYGERTVLLYQVGNFYEVYGYDPTNCPDAKYRRDSAGVEWNQAIGKAVEISVVLNCALTMENNNLPYAVTNPNKLGFPVIAYEKNKATLLANDYVIVRMDQDKKSGSLIRIVAEVCSPTMEPEATATMKPSNNILAIYIEYQKGANKLDNYLITCGVAVLDTTTGLNSISEFYSKPEDQIIPILDLYRFIIGLAPREMIIILQDLPNPEEYIDYLKRKLELARFPRVTFRVNELPADYRKINYQLEFFNKIFTKNLPSSIIKIKNDKLIEELGLEKLNYGRLAYLVLLNHINCYNKDLLINLPAPNVTWIDDQKHLVLTHNAIEQLNLLPALEKSKNTYDSLFAVLDQTATMPGKRLLLHRIRYPLLNIEEIIDSYEMINEILKTEALLPKLERGLKELPDISKLHRKMEIRKLTPREIVLLYRAYSRITEIYIILINSGAPYLHRNLLSAEKVANFNNFLATYGSLLNLEAFECCQLEEYPDLEGEYLEFNEFPFRKGCYPQLDAKYAHLQQMEQSLQQIIEQLNHYSSKNSKPITSTKIKRKNGPTSTGIVVTVAKANAIAAANINPQLYGEIKISIISTSERIINSEKIDYFCEQIDNTKLSLRRELAIIYRSLINDMLNRFHFYEDLVNLVARIDLMHCFAKISLKYNYYRPNIVKTPESFLDIKELRHPIVERLLDGHYITNDVSLGTDAGLGICCFGLNASGKTTIAKALALNIIMAQMGCYTAGKLTYSPYHNIITRLSGMDNILTGQSSFTIEMSELRTILRQSNAQTLVLGDELCRGTESNSATAITVSCILALIEKKSSFLFASHMHHLVNLPYISNLKPNQLRICHLAVTYDALNENLIYNRKLQDGNGSSFYGLMVAQSLGLPKNFIDKAYEVVRTLTNSGNEIINPLKSRYNAKVYLDSCARCHRSATETVLNTHHMEEQEKADTNGFVGNMKIHSKANLVVLCKDCHQKLHSEKKELAPIAIAPGKIAIIEK